MMGVYFGVMYYQTAQYTDQIEQSALSIFWASRRVPALLLTFFNLREYLFFDYATLAAENPQDPVLRVGDFNTNVVKGLEETHFLHFTVVFGDEASGLHRRQHGKKQQQLLYGNSCGITAAEFNAHGIVADPSFYNTCSSVESGILSHGLYAAFYQFVDTLAALLQPQYNGLLNHVLQGSSAPVGSGDMVNQALSRLRQLDTLINDYLSPILQFSTGLFVSDGESEVKAARDFSLSMLIVFLCGVALADLVAIRPMGPLLRMTSSRTQAMLLLLPSSIITGRTMPSLQEYIQENIVKHG